MSEVIVVGGGLAGMTVALRLLERGYQVSLYEATERLGGKAGANRHGMDFDEHGYHIFPAWYLNIWRIVDELNIRHHFVDCTDFEQLRPGDFPRFTTLRNITSLLSAPRNLLAGLLPIADMCLFFYSTLDLITQSYNYRAALDQVSMTGFLRSRFYRSEVVGSQYQDLILKGISVPLYYVSAMTMWNVLRYWVRYPTPMYRILSGNLQEYFIHPFEHRLKELGCAIYTHQRLERICIAGEQVSHLQLRDLATQDVREVQVDRVVIAIPAEKLAQLIDDEVYAAAPNLANVRYLNTRAMAALNIYFTKKLQGIPVDHVNLLDSKFGLSFIDVSQRWQGYQNTVLNLIASNFTPLENLSSDAAVAQILADLARFLPDFTPDDIAHLDFQAHLDEPLFMNDVGAWHFRPEMLPPEGEQRDGLINLYLAGDYCRSPVDLVCMEGAVTTGLMAAEALRRDAGIGAPVSIEPYRVPPRWLLLLSKYALLPFALAAHYSNLIRK